MNVQLPADAQPLGWVVYLQRPKLSLAESFPGVGLPRRTH